MYGMNEAYEKANIEVAKRQALKEIEVLTEKQKAEKRADVASARELQLTGIHLDTDGTVRVCKETFGGNLENPFPFKILDWKIYKTDNNDDEVLYVLIAQKKHHGLYFWLNKMDDRSINKKFNQAGIMFGFSHYKETEMRSKLIMKLVEAADEVYIPPRHGWYIKNGKIHFAHPNEITWKEVKQHE